MPQEKDTIQHKGVVLISIKGVLDFLNKSEAKDTEQLKEELKQYFIDEKELMDSIYDDSDRIPF